MGWHNRKRKTEIDLFGPASCKLPPLQQPDAQRRAPPLCGNVTKPVVRRERPKQPVVQTQATVHPVSLVKNTTIKIRFAVPNNGDAEATKKSSGRRMPRRLSSLEKEHLYESVTRTHARTRAPCSYIYTYLWYRGLVLNIAV